MQKSLKAILKYCDTCPELIGYYSQDIDLEMLGRLGYVAPMEPVEGLICRECSGLEGDSQLDSYVDRISGQTVFAIFCSDCGITPITDSDMKCWRVDAEAIARRFVKEVNIQGQVTAIIPDQLWHLGRRGNHQYLFARHLGEITYEALELAIRQYPKASIVTGSEYLMARLQKSLPNRCIALELSATFRVDGSMAFDESLLEEQKPDPTKQPHKRRGDRTAKIELCERAMKDHVFAAYDYMEDTARRGEIKLLPRPSQEMLGKMTNLSQKEVSRCLNDKEAKILRLLWEKSCTLDGIESLARMFRN